ncbi:MAG: glycosyl hydrolase [Acidobacteria bacterium]|nr:glycosyl hydrolase [Acidobacteriota bacterium]
MRLSIRALLLVLLLSIAMAAQNPPSSLNSNLLREWRWRLLGPSSPAGRAWTVVGVESDPKTLYVTTAGGGLWKTTNRGTTFVPVFDTYASASTGAVAIARSNKEIVWLGTGEPASTRANSWGDGVYKSTDGAKTWTHMGLEDSRQISAISIHPVNPGVVYVAAMGHHWGRGGERGIYKTTDGGETWTRPLYVDDVTGFIDLQMDPKNPDVLYAAAWQRVRWGNGDMTESGPGSGIYKTIDAGKTWTKLTNGLPTDPMGKIQISIARKNPLVVYAAVLTGEPGARGKRTSEQGGVFRSADGGKTWTRTNPMTTSYYYQEIYADPGDENTVWMSVFELWRSTDGGKNFEKVNMRHVHDDLHSIWIDPNDTSFVAVSGDGGVSISHDRCATWQQAVLPIAQFYEVNVDNQDPYFVYGGMQDTGHWIGPSQTYDMEGITAHDWIKLRWNGDGMGIAADPRDPNILYIVQEFGNTSRLDLRTWDRTELQPDNEEAKKRGATHSIRYDWSPAFALSRHNPDIVYLGSNYLFRIHGPSGAWEIISPDLSRQQEKSPKGITDGYHSYGALFSVAESPVNPQMLWAGADDGPVWVTRDAGRTWTDVTGNFPAGAPTYCVVHKIEASRFSPAVAYVAYDCHTREDIRPYLFATRDFGKTWQNITGDLPEKGSTYVIREDPINARVLYAGTEFGVFVTIDGGGRWVKMQNNLPTVAVRDMRIQERELDLVAGTFGRAIWVTDIAPFSEMTEATLAKTVHLFAVKPATLFKLRETYGATIEELNGDMFFRAENPPYGTMITYSLKEDVGGEVALKIEDAEGKPVRTIQAPGAAGIHRVNWDLKPDKDEKAAAPRRGELTLSEADFRERVPAGIYRVTLTAGGASETRTIAVRPEARDGVKQGNVRK